MKILDSKTLTKLYDYRDVELKLFEKTNKLFKQDNYIYISTHKGITIYKFNDGPKTDQSIYEYFLLTY